LGQSALLAEVFSRIEGDAPPVDLVAEAKHGQFIRDNRAMITACTDLSDGGLALAAFELAEAAGVGMWLDSDDTPTLFGEDQARYLIACNFDQAEGLMLAAGQAGVPIHSVGKFTGDTMWMGNCSAPMSELSEIYRSSFAAAIA
jgi:phosphoribosylformylglycinamidine (FGAM) synthase-like enzyme